MSTESEQTVQNYVNSKTQQVREAYSHLSMLNQIETITIADVEFQHTDSNLLCLVFVTPRENDPMSRYARITINPSVCHAVCVTEQNHRALFLEYNYHTNTMRQITPPSTPS